MTITLVPNGEIFPWTVRVWEAQTSVGLSIVPAILSMYLCYIDESGDPGVNVSRYLVLGRVFKMHLPICWPKQAGASLLLCHVFRRNMLPRRASPPPVLAGAYRQSHPGDATPSRLDSFPPMSQGRPARPGLPWDIPFCPFGTISETLWLRNIPLTFQCSPILILRNMAKLLSLCDNGV